VTVKHREITMKMLRNALAAISVLLCCPAWSQLVDYSFSGEGGLSGQFSLDSQAQFAITPGPIGNTGILLSPHQTLSGTYGGYSFNGQPGLYTFDQPADSDSFLPDYWIIRAPVASDSFNGLSIVGLNLFIYTGPGANPMSLTPPLHGTSQYDFQYTVQFSDGSFTGAGLVSLGFASPAPEPGALALVVVGLVAVGLGTRFRKQLTDRPA
jgi:hypothetical protein